jgi:hypothetical protein
MGKRGWNFSFGDIPSCQQEHRMVQNYARTPGFTPEAVSHFFFETALEK